MLVTARPVGDGRVDPDRQPIGPGIAIDGDAAQRLAQGETIFDNPEEALLFTEEV